MAAFGNAVADFQVVAQSGTGYIIAIDLSANRVRTVTQVQLMTAGLVFGTPIISQVNIEVLLGYLNASGAPAVAFTQTASTLYVFIKESSYPSAQANRIGLFFDANYTPGTVTTDFLDIPAEAKGLLKALTLKIIKQNAGRRTDLDITQPIVREKKSLGLT
jgi:hypothetical protein